MAEAKKTTSQPEGLQEKWRILAACSRALIRASDENAYLQSVTDIVINASDYLLAWIGMAEPGPALSIPVAASAGAGRDFLNDVRVTWSEDPGGRGPTGRAVRTARPAVIPDIIADPECAPYRHVLQRHGIASAVALPLVTAQGVIGTLTIYSNQKNAFQQQELELLEALASDISFGIEWLRTRAENRGIRNRLEAMVRALPDLLFVADPHGNFITFHAPENAYLLLPPDKIPGTNIRDALPPDIADRGIAAYQETLKTGEPKIFDYEIEIEGSARSFEARLIACSPNEILSIIRDITEFKQARERLERQLHRHSLLNEITRSITGHQDIDSIFEIVLTDLIDDFPADLCAVFNFDADAGSIRLLHAKVSASEFRPRRFQPNARYSARENGLQRCVEGLTVHHPGIPPNANALILKELREAGLSSVVFAPMAAEGGTHGVLLAARTAANAFGSQECEFLRQLSEHVGLAMQNAELNEKVRLAYEELKHTRAAAMQQERLSAMGRMASGIAHDINNALGPIIAYPEMLLDGREPLSEATRSCMATMQAAGKDILATVQRLREFYRPRPLEASIQTFDLNAVIQQAVDITRPRWRTEPEQYGTVIDVEFDLQEDLPPMQGEEGELRQAIVNLILNASDALEKTGGTITCRTRANQDMALVDIGDDGPGMEEETQARCLEPFFSTKGERGTGLGLAMVYGVVRRHDGQIDVATKPGEGTVFHLAFPLLSPLGEESQCAQDQLGELPPLRILCIDDDPMMRETLARILEHDGHTVVTASSGEEGLLLYEQSHSGASPFDAVFSDLGMPRMDGRQVLRALRKLDPDVPAFLITGWGPSLEEQEDSVLSTVSILSKPPRPASLRNALWKAFSQKNT